MKGMNPPKLSVFEMVYQVNAEAEAQLQKEAQADEPVVDQEDNAEEAAEEPKSDAYHLKVADACDWAVDNFSLLDDGRSPEEKIAELVAVQEALQKQAAEAVPMDPPQDSGDPVPGGSDAAMAAEENQQSGDNPAEAGQMGAATPAHQTPKNTAPKEKTEPTAAPTSMETNREMMHAEQPEEVLKQSVDQQAAEVLQKLIDGGHVSKEAMKGALPASFEANAAKVQAAQDPGKAGAETAGGASLKKKAEEAGVPSNLAAAMISKFKVAEDAINPASVSGGTAPVLQSAAGVTPAMNQGHEAGEATPDKAKGQSAGRELIQSNEAAINATKGQAKKPVKSPLAEVLTEPALSKAHDPVLNKSLSSTSDAGVKISAAQELLKKLAASSPDAAAWVKTAMAAAEAGEPIPPPGQEVAGAAEALTDEAPVSDEAMAAAAEGVTTNELAAAQTMLAAQAQEAAAASAASAPPPEAEGAPEGGTPSPEAAPVQA
jgi:hypothetical protein